MKDMMSLQETVRAFGQYLRTEEKSGNTIGKYCRDCTKFLMFNDSLSKNEGGTDAPVTKESVIAYKAYLLEHQFVKCSINSMLSSVNAYLDFRGMSDCKVKLFKIQREIFCRKEKELSKTEFQRLCDTAKKEGNRRLYLLLQTLCGTGIRVSELQFVTAEAVKRGEAVVTLKGKTRLIFFVRELRSKLLAYAKEQGITSGQIFITKGGKPMNRTNIWREMKSLCSKAKVDDRKVFPHNLRHLFAKLFYAVRKDIAKLADILGHSSIETTRIYIASSGAEYRRLMERTNILS